MTAVRRSRRRSRRGAKRAVLGAVIVTAVLGAGVPGASAAETATLTGTVLNGTSGTAAAEGAPAVRVPAPGIDVVLHVYQGDTEVSTKSVASGADGTFSFADLPVATERKYALSADYQKVTYGTEIVSLTAAETKTLDLTIYEVGNSTEKLKVTEWLVWVDREGSGIAVQHDVTFENSGKTSFAGDEDLGKGEKAVTRLPLPPGATNFQYMGLFMQCCAQVNGDTFIHTAAVQPGQSSGTVRVSTAELDRLDLTAQLPTDTLRVFLPTDAKVTAPAGFKAEGTIEDLGTAYQVFTAQNLRQGQMLSLQVEGLDKGGSGSLLWLVPAGLVLVVGVGAFVVVRRRRRGGAGRSTSAGRPGSRVQGHSYRRPSQRLAARAPSAGAAREREMIVEEVAALDVAFERGALPADTYRRLREEKIAELLGSPAATAEKGAE